ncbi:pilus assembly protein [Undibacterium sp.]|uniref:pilus assembly protein n=1 Tax=Undibacterium sp. TaxID=1914977 RepID=UPI00374C89A4
MTSKLKQTLYRSAWPVAALITHLVFGCGLAQAQTKLSDVPLFSTNIVPGNVLLTLSVEFPTANGKSHTSAYDGNNTYIGYFDPMKCYTFNRSDPSIARRYFEPGPTSNVNANAKHECSGLWSGNFMNWATTPTIDPFRWGLTGGNRSIDEVALTVLEKANSTTSGFTIQTLTGGVSKVTPFNWPSISVRVYQLGKSMRFSGSGSLTANDNEAYNAPLDPTPGTTLTTTLVPAAGVYDLPVRVRVCDATKGLEANCTQYGSNYKPEGLIQQYSDKLRFGAFGYLLDNSITRDGGVLRARMKSVGPLTPRPGQSSIANANREWDPSTGIYVISPDTADATTSGVSNSGVINYLNKFGLTAGYKTYDPVGELYYAGIRYLKGLSNVPEYSTLTGSTANQASQLDGFPVITDWIGGTGRPYDPVQYSCQKNFIIGIGDTNTHADTNIPGSTMSKSLEPAVPSAVTADTTVDARVATNKVGDLEGLTSILGNLGEIHPSWCCNNNGYLMAGLAYDSHTKDMRPSDFGTQKGSFKTTVSTYWLDVMESGQGGTSGKNQFWLTAKYGGFTVPSGYDPYVNTTALPTSLWNTSGRKDLVGNLSPENYYDASKADLMVSGLTSAFKDINSKNGSSSTLGLVSPRISSTSNANYSSTYDASTWTGNVIGSTITLAADGTPTITKAWDAQANLENLVATSSNTGWNTQRVIVTSNATSAGQGVPFRYTNLTNTTFRSALGNSSTNQTNVINYLRGDRSNEGSAGTQAYRARIALLGDITNSAAIPVGPPASSYADAYNAGYSQFKTNYASRKSMVYVGANDGMMHAFNGALTGAGAGNEAFAYVPSVLYSGPSSPATPAVDGLLSFSNINFVHHFFVDAAPFIVDVDFAKAGTPTAAISDWRSLLVGGLGKGGKAFYALDVTDPGAMNSESAAAGKVLWEFTDAKMGYSYGQPVIVKTAKYGWVVILTSGYNNADGIGYFFIVNPKTGLLLEPPIPTGAGTATNPSGLSEASSYVLNYGDFTADSVYAGDLLGNLWRLDLTKTSGNYSNPTKIATLTAPDGTVQPVTTKPLIEVDADSLKRYVFIGTGRLLDDTDIVNSQVQTFYALNDGTQTAFDTAATLPTGVTYPITRTKLNADSNTLNGIGSNPVLPSGYYVDLPVVNNIGSRVTINPIANNNIVAFVANLPQGDVCTPSGSNTPYAINFSTGKSVLVDANGNLVAYGASGSGLATSMAFVKNENSNTGNGNIGLLVGNDRSGVSQYAGKFSDNDKFKQMNWREIPATD